MAGFLGLLKYVKNQPIFGDGLSLGSSGVVVGIYSGAGAPSGAYGTEAVQVYLRNDAASVSAIQYLSRDTGSTWAQAQGVANVITDPGDAGAIPVTSSGTCALSTPGGAQTRTVAIPTFAGQLLGLSFDVDGGDCVVTFAQAINQASNTVATAADTGDHLLLQGVTLGGALRWRVVANDGWALS